MVEGLSPGLLYWYIVWACPLLLSLFKHQADILDSSTWQPASVGFQCFFPLLSFSVMSYSWILYNDLTYQRTCTFVTFWVHWPGFFFSVNDLLFQIDFVTKNSVLIELVTWCPLSVSWSNRAIFSHGMQYCPSPTCCFTNQNMECSPQTQTQLHSGISTMCWDKNYNLLCAFNHRIPGNNCIPIYETWPNLKTKTMQTIKCMSWTIQEY